MATVYAIAIAKCVFPVPGLPIKTTFVAFS